MTDPQDQARDGTEADGATAAPGVGTTAAGAAVGPAPWRTVCASVTGDSHVARGAGSDDAFAVATAGQWFAAVSCDGAGSAKHSGEGAQLISRHIVDRLCETLPERDPAVPLRRLIATALEQARDTLAERADAEGNALHDFHTTVVGCVGRPGRALMFQIGDGAGIAFGLDRSQPERPTWRHLRTSAPENGEYANETFFITEAQWRERLRFTFVPAPDCVALMSDGVTDFALDRSQVAPAMAFFDPLLRFLSDADSRVADAALERMLQRDDVRRISSDDKTLVIVLGDAPPPDRE